MPTLDRATCAIHYVDEGMGEPVLVFLHGWCGSSATFSETIAALSRSNRCVAPDMRGHGRSTTPFDHKLDVETLCGDVLALCLSLGLTKPLLVGHSYGAFVAAELATRHPDFSRGLILIDQPMDLAALAQQMRAAETAIRSPASHMAFRESLFASLNTDPPHAVVAREADSWRTTPIEVGLALWAPLFDWSIEDLRARGEALLSAIGRHPTIVLDRAEIPGYHDALRRAMPSQHVRVVPGGHWLHLEHPAILQTAVGELLALSGSTSALVE